MVQGYGVLRLMDLCSGLVGSSSRAFGPALELGLGAEVHLYIFLVRLGLKGCCD